MATSSNLELARNSQGMDSPLLADFQPSTTLKRWAERDKNAVALVGQSMTLSTTELLEVLFAVVNGLREEGVTRESLVAIDVGDELSIISALALIHLGAKWTSWLGPNEKLQLPFSHVITVAGNESAQDSRAIVLSDVWLGRASLAPTPPSEFKSDEVCFYTLSSGTTGNRKALPMTAEVTDTWLKQFAERFEHEMPLLTLFGLPSLLPLETALVSLALQKPYLVPGPAAHNVDLIDRFDVTCIYASPNFLRAIADASTPAMRAAWRVKAVRCAGGRLGPTLVAQFKETPGCEVYSHYGSSETGIIAVGPMVNGSSSAGVLSPGITIEIRDPDGNPLASGQEGEIFVTRPQMVQNYVATAGDDSHYLRDGWFRTGDLGYLVDRELFLAGRTNERISAGGTKIDPLDADLKMTELDTVKEAACFSYVDSRGDSNWGVAVVPTATFDPEEFAAACYTLFGEARPALIVAVKSIPRNAMGKAMRQELADQVLGIDS